MRGGAKAGARAVSTAPLCLLVAALLVFAAPAQAKEVRLPQGQIGSFTEPRGLAVDQGSHDVYAVSGRNEQQSIKVSATAGKFKLEYEGKTSGELAFNIERGPLETALSNLICGGGNCVVVNGGPGDETGSAPYRVTFANLLATTDVAELECVNGTPPLTGGSGCSVTTTANGVNGSVARYHADGTPAEFPALGSNAIDGLGGADLTPQKGLRFSPSSLETQVAVDESGGETAGEIYVTQPEDHKVDVFGPGGEHLGELSEYEETPGNPATLKALGRVCSAAVDAAGDVYLADTVTGIHEYGPVGNMAANTDSVANFKTVSEPCGLAAGSGPTAGSLFAVAFNEGKLFKLDANTGEVKYGGKPISKDNVAVTVDPKSGHVLAAANSVAAGNRVTEWDASGEGSATLLGSLPAGSATAGVAVDGAGGKGGTVYLSRAKVSHLDVYGPLVIVPDVTTEVAGGVGPASATLHGTISAAGGAEAHCHFQYLTDAAYQAQLKTAEEASEPKTEAEIANAAFAGAASVPCSPAGPFTGNGLNAVSAKVEGLAHETAYRFRIVGENEEGQIPAEQALFFETFGKPKVKGGEASEVTTSAAKISGEVNPGGQATSFAVQYVAEAEFLKSGYNNATSVPEPAEDLGSGTTFLEVSEPLSGLVPDTAYRFRLVATNTDGTTLGKEGAFATFAPPSGPLDGRAYELVSPVPRMGEVFTPEPGPRGGLGGSCKSCTPGWNNDKAPMQASPDGGAVAYEGDPFFSGLASEANSYVSRRTEGGWQTTPLSEPQFEAQDFKGFSPDLSKAIVRQAEPSLTPEAPPNFANLYLREEGKGLATLIATKPPNRSSGTEGENLFKVTYAGANAGNGAVEPFTHVVFQANDALSEAVPGIAPKAPAVKASETDLYEWSGGQLRLVNVLPGNEKAAANATIGSGGLLGIAGENFDFDHTISDDGSRVFWSTQPAGQVFVREGGASTTKVPDPGKFITAAPDGSKVLLSDGKVYDLEAKSLTDLTNGAGGFEGMAGASEDLSRIYFVDTKALTPSEEENANGEAAEEGEFNLYLWEEGEVPAGGTLSFIASLQAGDNKGGQDLIGVWHAAPGDRLAQASADGRFLAFESRAPLTGYDSLARETKSCIAIGTEGSPVCFEVFEYDAASGSLTCVSCNPSGVRPLGGSNLSLINTNGESFLQPHNLPPEGEGRLFFESLDRLTLADQNGRRQDIYEFEPGGVGSCERAKGCLSLISSGQDPKDSQFIDASATGDDVFFTTRAQLLPADRNDFMDLYDSRVGGGIEEPPLPVPCEGEACKGPVPSTPEAPGALTPSFEGPGNPPPPRPCAKGKVRRHGKCLKRPRRHRHAHRKRGGSR